MNSKLTLCATCCAALLLTASLAVGAPRGGGGAHFSSMRGGHTFARGPGTFSRSGAGTFHNSVFIDHHRRFHDNFVFDHHRRFRNEFIFIGDFGFPWWWGWGWYPWGWGYPYGYYDYGYPGYGGYGYDYGQSGYGSGYGGYGYGTHSRVAELQRRLARAGYYHGAIDGIMGPQTRRAIRAYERDRGYVG